ncbi:sumo ligase [Colletotrichum chrysophilum]|uniref:Sumo ligase n=1 Tax=Colletotrichum chrysophilum TaxID=1836956 RepID=A0AAD9AEA5_9PEZI|nr:sumo ligase [Colletotrichum chrysophilum]
MRSDPYWNQRSNGRPTGLNGHSMHSFGATIGPSFKDTPFYAIQHRVGDVKVCETMSQHRNMVSVPVKLSDCPGVNKVLEDKSYRVMVFCADSNSNSELQNITFPHQSEIKVNGNEVKANLRGLKNKPGSTRPVDVTSYLRLKNDNRNLVEFTYALTQKVSVGNMNTPRSSCPVLTGLNRNFSSSFTFARSRRLKSSLSGSKLGRRFLSSRSSRKQQEGSRYGHRHNIASIVSEMPTILHAARRSVSLYILLAYPVLRCYFIPSVAGARPSMAVSYLQQVRTVRSTCGRRIRQGDFGQYVQVIGSSHDRA